MSMVLSAAALAMSFQATSWCLTGEGKPCSVQELNSPHIYRQILVLPAGFQQKEYGLFRAEFTRLLQSMSSSPRTNYSSQYRSQLLYIGYWVPGGAIGTPEATFAASIPVNPFRGKALTIDQDAIVKKVADIKEYDIPYLSPASVVVIYNDLQDEVTPNASPPTFFGKSWGLGRFTRRHLDGTYAPSHEIGHSALNLADEYIEHGFENLSIGTLDVLTPLAILRADLTNLGESLGNFFGVYDYHISEIIAANGQDNIDTTRYPSRVVTSGYSPNEYEYEGGFFFGKGTYHDRGRNLMGSNRAGMPDDDGFAYAHSESQQGVIAQFFNPRQGAVRPNDRIRNAGPISGWPLHLGGTIKVLLFDADKNHHFQPTNTYEVQVGWYERHWKTCWAAFIPYPCKEDKWVTAQKQVAPKKGIINLRTTSLFGIAGTLQDIVCHLGINEIPMGGKNVNICNMGVPELAQTFLPSVNFPMPYQFVEVPSSQWMTKYYWRFRTKNGVHVSGWTSWSDFYRSF